MARIRTVKPDFFRHEKLFEAEQATGLPLRVAFAGLWTVADREGRFRWRPRIIKLDVLPFDAVDFGHVLDALATRGFIHRYEVDGEPFGNIPSFLDHQHINQRESKSDLPSPAEADACTDAHVQESGEGKGRELEGEGKSLPEPVVTFPNTAPSQASGAAGADSLRGQKEAETVAAVEQKDDLQACEEGRAAPKSRYPAAFEELWLAYRPIAEPNATKADAHTAWKRLSAPDRAACLVGLGGYVSWLKNERRTRPDAPAKHLSTFINRRGWETAPMPPAGVPASTTTWLTEDDPRWPVANDRSVAERGRPLLASGSRHAVGIGCHVPASWLEQKAGAA